MTMEKEQELFKFKSSRKRNKPSNKVKHMKKKANAPSKDFSKLYNVNPQGKIKKKRVKKQKPFKKSDAPPRQEFNLEELEEKIKKIKDLEEPNKKTRKKLRQLEHLQKKIMQHMLTEKSLELDNVDSNDATKDSDGEDHDDIENDSMKVNEDMSESEDEGGKKRFVLFVGNLPTDVTENDIRQHFAKVGTITSVRIPEQKENRKKGFAFVELEDRISYEKTLSMHHTMLNNKRINVIYTNPDGKNLDKKEIMRKNAKLDALRKAGKLAGSVAQHKKRSFRRKKKKMAEAKASAAMKT